MPFSEDDLILCPCCRGTGQDPDAEFDRFCLICGGAGAFPSPTAHADFWNIVAELGLEELELGR